MKAKKGFTLVEILIVVVILGILAAIVIPQFTDASEQAKIASLRSDLQMFRSQIELYKAQHNDELPTDVGHLGLVDALTPVNGLGITDQYGATVAAGTDGAVGPYMREIPSNPFVVAAVADLFTEAAGGNCLADGTTGWWFNTLNGDIRANSDTAKWPDHIDF
ncbi:MAG: type IV pilin protein [Planctomycetota bacterium]|jgi:general secretion pathway protein G